MKNLWRRIFPSKEMRRYRKMHSRHHKELVKLAKETAEYDWCWLHEMVVMQVKHMHEYYSAGDNVYQVDESRLEIIEQLQHVLDLNAEIDYLDNNVWTLESVDKINELYEELYGSIGKNIQCWWD